MIQWIWTGSLSTKNSLLVFRCKTRRPRARKDPGLIRFYLIQLKGAERSNPLHNRHLILRVQVEEVSRAFQERIALLEDDQVTSLSLQTWYI